MYRLPTIVADKGPPALHCVKDGPASCAALRAGVRCSKTQPDLAAFESLICRGLLSLAVAGQKRVIHSTPNVSRWTSSADAYFELLSGLHAPGATAVSNSPAPLAVARNGQQALQDQAAQAGI